MKSKRLILSALGLAAALFAVGCEKKSPAEKAVDDVGDAVEEAADEVGDAVRNAD
jgi:hypothetical protein